MSPAGRGAQGGAFAFGPTTLEAGDPFGFTTQELEIGIPIELLPYLLPLALLIIILLRRPQRTHPEVSSAEERESVWSWQAAGQDLQTWW